MIEPESTLPTLDDALLDSLRRDGLAGPFEVAAAVGGTRTGRVRVENEDRWGRGPGPIFVVADGMGGKPGGAVAAVAAVESLTRGEDATCRDLRSALAEADQAVTAASEAADVPGAGTTVVALVAFPGHCLILSLGDSRVYRWRAEVLELLTTDHSLGEELKVAGVPPERAQAEGLRLDLLTGHLGAASSSVDKASIETFSVRHGDRFLLCTDGIHRQLEDDQIIEALLEAEADQVVISLLDRADDAGGRDNATAVVVDFASVGATR